jgi:hypothetical protein
MKSECAGAFSQQRLLRDELHLKRTQDRRIGTLDPQIKRVIAKSFPVPGRGMTTTSKNILRVLTIGCTFMVRFTQHHVFACKLLTLPLHPTR